MKTITNTLSFLLIAMLVFINQGCNNDEECSFVDLQITATPASITLSAGASESITVNIQAVINYCDNHQQVQYSVNVSSTAPEDINGTICNGVLNETHSGTCTMIINAPASAPTGTYDVQLLGQATYNDQNVIDDTYIQVMVTGSSGSFTFEVADSLDIVKENGMYYAPVTVTRNDGHDADIWLSIEGTPANTYLEFDPNRLIGTATQTKLQSEGYWDATPGNYNISLKATDGTDEITQELFMKILEPYYLSFSSNAINIQVGDTGTIDITAHRTETFIEDVMLHISGTIIGNATNGVNASFSVNPMVNPDSLSVLILPVGPEVLPGVYTLNLDGWASGIQEMYQLELTVD